MTKKKKKRKFFEEISRLISRKQHEGSLYSNLECGLPCMEATYNVNLVLFREDITELWMCENRNFVVPVNALTPFARALFSWAALCVLIMQRL